MTSVRNREKMYEIIFVPKNWEFGTSWTGSLICKTLYYGYDNQMLIDFIDSEKNTLSEDCILETIPEYFEIKFYRQIYVFT